MIDHKNYIISYITIQYILLLLVRKTSAFSSHIRADYSFPGVTLFSKGLGDKLYNYIITAEWRHTKYHHCLTPVRYKPGFKINEKLCCIMRAMYQFNNCAYIVKNTWLTCNIIFFTSTLILIPKIPNLVFFL